MSSPPEGQRRSGSARSANARSLRALRTRIGQALADLTAGGGWTHQVAPSVRRSLRWFWFDGVFAASSDTVIASYLNLFVLALGGTRAQLGLTSSLSNLSAALLVLPGGALVERLGRHKQFVVLNSLVARAMLLCMALLPLMFSGSDAVLGVIVLAVAYSAFANVSVPAWTPLTANLVPLAWRGRYFSARNIAMVISGMVTTYAAGWLITLLGVPHGYQVAIAAAFIIGLAASYAFARIEVDPSAGPRDRGTAHPVRQPLWEPLRQHPAFLAFCGAAAVWNFSVSLGGPFFNAYLVEGLGGSASTVGLLTVVNSLAALPGYRLFGRLNDRWGPRRVQLLTGLLIPIMPLIWVVAQRPWHVIPAAILGGFLWAGYGIAAFSFQLELTPSEHLPRWSALVHMLVLVSAAARSRRRWASCPALRRLRLPCWVASAISPARRSVGCWHRPGATRQCSSPPRWGA